MAHLELTVPFAKLINECLMRSTFQDLLKCAELNPIVKKSHSLQKGNYRPVSVLTIISKSYESVMNDQMTKHFIEIWEDHSCQALLFKCVDDWKQDLDNSSYISWIFLRLLQLGDVKQLIVFHTNMSPLQQTHCLRPHSILDAGQPCTFSVYAVFPYYIE